MSQLLYVSHIEFCDDYLTVDETNLKLLEDKRDEIILVFHAIQAPNYTKEPLIGAPFRYTPPDTYSSLQASLYPNLESPSPDVCQNFASNTIGFVNSAKKFNRSCAAGQDIQHITNVYKYWFHAALVALDKLATNAKLEDFILTQSCKDFHLLMNKEFFIHTSSILQKVSVEITDEEIDDENRCLICKSKYKTQFVIHRLSCGHCFHRDCIDNFLFDNLQCPACRTHIITSELNTETLRQTTESPQESSSQSSDSDVVLIEENMQPAAAPPNIESLPLSENARQEPISRIESNESNSNPASENSAYELGMSPLSKSRIDGGPHEMADLPLILILSKTDHIIDIYNNIKRELFRSRITNYSQHRFSTPSRNVEPYRVHSDLWASQQRNVESRRRASIRNIYIPSADNFFPAEYDHLCTEFHDCSLKFAKAAKIFYKRYACGEDVNNISGPVQNCYKSTLQALGNLTWSVKVHNILLQRCLFEFKGMMLREFKNYLSKILIHVSHVYKIDEEMCVICQTPVTIEQELRRLKCNHSFHRECIDRWLLECFDCPICRKSIVKLDSNNEESRHPSEGLVELGTQSDLTNAVAAGNAAENRACECILSVPVATLD